MIVGNLKPNELKINGFVRVGEPIVVTVATDQVTFDIQNENDYILYSFAKVAVNTTSLFARINNDSSSLYKTQQIRGQGSVINASNDSRTGFELCTTTQDVGDMVNTSLSLTQNDLGVSSISSLSNNIVGTTVEIIAEQGAQYANASLTWSTLDIVSDTVDGIDIGSTFILFKRVRK